MTAQMQTLKAILAQLAPLPQEDQTELVNTLAEIVQLQHARISPPREHFRFRVLGQGHQTLHGPTVEAIHAGPLDPAAAGMLTMDQAATALGVTREAAYVIIRRSKIEVRRRGRQIYVDPADVSRIKEHRSGQALRSVQLREKAEREQRMIREKAEQARAQAKKRVTRSRSRRVSGVRKEK